MLGSILTLAGLVLGVTLFLYFLSVVSGTKRAASTEKQQGSLDPGTLYRRRRPADGPLPRICPVCGSFLEREEYLIAALGPEPGEGKKRQAQIYGCPHCYGDLEPGMSRIEAPGTNSIKETSKIP